MDGLVVICSNNGGGERLGAYFLKPSGGLFFVCHRRLLFPPKANVRLAFAEDIHGFRSGGMSKIGKIGRSTTRPQSNRNWSEDQPDKTWFGPFPRARQDKVP